MQHFQQKGFVIKYPGTALPAGGGGMPYSTMFENEALLVSAAVELYFIKINRGGVIL